MERKNDYKTGIKGVTYGKDNYASQIPRLEGPQQYRELLRPYQSKKDYQEYNIF